MNTICRFVLIASFAISLVSSGAIVSADDWESLFDGKTLKGWTKTEGPATFEVVDGAIRGRTGTGGPNTFLTRGSYADFELEFSVKCDPELNSGVQIRSHLYDKETPQESKPNRMRAAGEVYGYQCEIRHSSAGKNGCSGNFWDEGRRTKWLDESVVSTESQKAYKPGEWNRVRIVAKGNRVQSFVNGVAVANFTDDRDASGFIGLQVHAIKSDKGPYHVSWKDIRIKVLDAD